MGDLDRGEEKKFKNKIKIKNIPSPPPKKNPLALSLPFSSLGLISLTLASRGDALGMGVLPRVPLKTPPQTSRPAPRGGPSTAAGWGNSASRENKRPARPLANPFPPLLTPLALRGGRRLGSARRGDSFI